MLPCFEKVSYADRDRENPVLMVQRSRLVLAVGDQRHRWHPGLLHTRLEAGWSHPLVRAMALEPGHRVLDCSLGLGIDAQFMAHLTGRTVWAVEASAAVAMMTAEGLGRVGADIQVVHGEAEAFMRTLPDNCVDVVQGDPMFPPGTGVTPSLAGLRAAAHHAPLGAGWVGQALRVARHRVVVRDVEPGQLLEEMRAPEVLRVGRGRPRYGVWRVILEKP
ncbi:MAG: class I SAM-dependent methyltransferase [Myxococcota bacterium]